MRFADATAVSAVAAVGPDTTLSGSFNEGWDILGNINGGYSMGLMARAAQVASDRPDIVSVSASFLAPGRPGPARIECHTHKSGKRFATMATDLFHEDPETGADRHILSGTVVTGDLTRGDGLDFALASPPDMPSPDECIRSVPGSMNDFFPPPFSGKIDMRLHPEDGDLASGSNDSGRMRVWFRLLDGEPMDSAACVLACDSMPPTAFNTPAGMGWTPTVQMTTHVRARPTSEWLMIDSRTRVIQDGMLEVDAEAWQPDGTLVAQSRQLALVAKLG